MADYELSVVHSLNFDSPGIRTYGFSGSGQTLEFDHSYDMDVSKDIEQTLDLSDDYATESVFIRTVTQTINFASD